MIFADADTPRLANLEEFLEPWGVKIQREGDATYEIVDPDSKLDGEGTTIVAQYEQGGMGNVITQDLVKNGGSPKVVFKNATSFVYSDSYQITYEAADETGGSAGFSYGLYNRNRVSRMIFDIFSTTDSALAYAKPFGTQDRLQNADGTVWTNAQSPFSLMTVTRQREGVSEGNAGSVEYLASYLCAFGSTEFASNEVLASNSYGNTDVLMETLRMIGKEIEPIGLEFKPMFSSSIDSNYYAPTAPVVWTAVLILLPAIAFTIAGCVVLVKRKHHS